MIAGSTGFTLIKHKCYVCGQEDIRSSISLVLGNETLCCHDDKEAGCHHHDADECVIDDDSCSHETEKMVSDDIARTEVQPDIIPYFTSAVQNDCIHKPKDLRNKSFADDKIYHKGRDLTTIHCQILA